MQWMIKNLDIEDQGKVSCAEPVSCVFAEPVSLNHSVHSEYSNLTSPDLEACPLLGSGGMSFSASFSSDFSLVYSMVLFSVTWSKKLQVFTWINSLI